MLIIRFLQQNSPVLAAVVPNGGIYKLPQRDFLSFVGEAGAQNLNPTQFAEQLVRQNEPMDAGLGSLRLLPPIEAPEVWAAGVTYERSKEARNYETTENKADGETFYDKVYHAERPELFIKSTPLRTVGPFDELCLRSDSGWQVPEPELGLVLDRTGKILGYTIGNDMSCRDIEGENPLYLPQAKVWRRSCSIGPAIRLAETVEDPLNLQITCSIHRQGLEVFAGTANTRQLKRSFAELIGFLCRDNDILDGTLLLTGTCIVPPNEFTLLSGDRVDITITGIGTLSNPVVQA